MTRPLGRIAIPDNRDLQHLLRAARPAAFTTPIDQLPLRKHYQRGALLDQGSTGTCVEHGLEAKLRGAPVKVGDVRLPARYTVYDRAIQLDESADNDHDIDRTMGTTVRAGCKVLQAMGMILEYKWVYSVEETLQWILGGHGGLVLGIDWWSGMDEPSAEGVIRMTGNLRGGHCLYAYGADRQANFIDLQQSWGPGWGGWTQSGRRVNAGCARLPLTDLKRLLDGNAELVTIVETPYKPTPPKRKAMP